MNDPGAPETLRVHIEDTVVFAQISAPPMNLRGPELVRDLVTLIRRAEADTAAALKAGFQTHEAELALGRRLGELS